MYLPFEIEPVFDPVEEVARGMQFVIWPLFFLIGAALVYWWRSQRAAGDPAGAGGPPDGDAYAMRSLGVLAWFLGLFMLGHSLSEVVEESLATQLLEAVAEALLVVWAITVGLHIFRADQEANLSVTSADPRPAEMEGDGK